MLRVENLDLAYGAAQVLRRVSVTAQIGQVTCVLGRNGMGKTSLLRAIAGQYPPLAGHIEWDGHEINTWPAYRRASHGIAFVPQGREIFPLLTVEENLLTGYASLKRSQRSIPSEIYDLFPVLKTMLRRRGGDLSGGQQQQLAIARALVTRPRLLILDEPTEGIQPSIIKDIERVIHTLAERGDMAILLVEQYFDFAQSLADNFIVMERGEAVISGGRGDLANPAIRKYLVV